MSVSITGIKIIPFRTETLIQGSSECVVRFQHIHIPLMSTHLTIRGIKHFKKLEQLV